MQHSFFAYGSFAKGQFHHSKISQLICGEKKAFVKADVYRLRCGFPALVPSNNGDLVEGVVYDLNAPETFWSIIDELLGVDLSRQEKCFFNRKTVEVQVDNFSYVQSQAYCLNHKKMTSAHKKITGGDWMNDLLKRPPITLSLQARQKQYIHKLSKTKGRDIVPIKLDLYRELMNMELIVDKGRRLALTPLGKETAFFTQ